MDFLLTRLNSAVQKAFRLFAFEMLLGAIRKHIPQKLLEKTILLKMVTYSLAWMESLISLIGKVVVHI